MIEASRLVIDTRRRVIAFGDQTLRLHKKSWEVIEPLVLHPGKIQSWDALRDHASALGFECPYGDIPAVRRLTNFLNGLTADNPLVSIYGSYDKERGIDKRSICLDFEIQRVERLIGSDQPRQTAPKHPVERKHGQLVSFEVEPIVAPKDPLEQIPVRSYAFAFREIVSQLQGHKYFPDCYTSDIDVVMAKYAPPDLVREAKKTYEEAKFKQEMIKRLTDYLGGILLRNTGLSYIDVENKGRVADVWRKGIDLNSLTSQIARHFNALPLGSSV